MKQHVHEVVRIVFLGGSEGDLGFRTERIFKMWQVLQRHIQMPIIPLCVLHIRLYCMCANGAVKLKIRLLRNLFSLDPSMKRTTGTVISYVLYYSTVRRHPSLKSFEFFRYNYWYCT
jgi:hypothetical protein